MKFDILVTNMHLEYGRGQGPRTPVKFAYNGGDLLKKKLSRFAS